MYKAGDKVIATRDFSHPESGDDIKKGDIDVVESVSSDDYHGGQQVNLVTHGIGWSNDVWQHFVRLDAVTAYQKTIAAAMRLVDAERLDAALVLVADAAARGEFAVNIETQYDKVLFDVLTHLGFRWEHIGNLVTLNWARRNNV